MYIEPFLASPFLSLRRSASFLTGHGNYVGEEFVPTNWKKSRKLKKQWKIQEVLHQKVVPTGIAAPA